MLAKDLFVDVVRAGPAKAYTQADVLKALRTVELADGVEDPATWY